MKLRRLRRLEIGAAALSSRSTPSMFDQQAEEEAEIMRGGVP